MNKIRQFDLQGSFIKEFKNVKEAALKVQGNRSSIYACAVGKRYSHKGFRWTYERTEKEMKSLTRKMTRRVKDLTGQKFRLLTVINYIRSDKRGQAIWNCLCDCGRIKEAYTNKLLKQETGSCGCLHKRIGQNNPKYKGYGELSSSFWAAIKTSAKKRNIKFLISIKEAWELFEAQNKKCALTGVKLEFQPRAIGRGTASLDRIDSDKGYIFENIQWVHKIVNNIKWELNQTEFIDWCKKIAKYNG